MVGANGCNVHEAVSSKPFNQLRSIINIWSYSKNWAVRFDFASDNVSNF